MVPLGLAIGGPLADAFGVRLLFLVGGAGCLVLALIWVFTPAVLYLEEQPLRETDAAAAPVADAVVPDV